MPELDTDFEAQIDADTLIRAQEIRQSPDRMRKAAMMIEKKKQMLAKAMGEDEGGMMREGFTRL